MTHTAENDASDEFWERLRAWEFPDDEPDEPRVIPPG